MLTPVATCGTEPINYDTDFDGLVGPSDVLAIVQHLNQDRQYNPFLDVNCDQSNTPLDALLAINHINKFGAGSLGAYPIFGQPIVPSSISTEESALIGIIPYQIQGNRTASVTVEVLVRVDGRYDSQLRPILSELEFIKSRIASDGSIMIYTFSGVLSRGGFLEMFADTRELDTGSLILITMIRTEWNTVYRQPSTSGISWGPMEIT